jgi:hypothetical protein
MDLTPVPVGTPLTANDRGSPAAALRQIQRPSSANAC